MINIPEIQLQTVFYLGYSKRNITSVQAPVLGKNVLLADKSDNHVLYSRWSNFVTAAAWYGLVCKANGRARTIVFPFRKRQKKLRVVLYTNGFSDVIFYLPHTAIVLGIENYPSAFMSCWSDDLALLLPH